MKLIEKRNFKTVFFKIFESNNNVKYYSRKNPLGAVFAENFNLSIRNLKRPIFEKAKVNWLDILPTIAGRNKNRIHSSTKLTPIQVSLKKKEGFVYRSL